MNGIHDMGGMHGFGPIPIEHDEPVFHEPWEGRVHGLLICVRQANPFPNGFRVALESLPPEVYLSLSYYERWLRAWRDGVVRTGLITEAGLAGEETASRAEPDRQVPRREDPERAKAVVEGLRRTLPPSRDPGLVPGFNVGDPCGLATFTRTVTLASPATLAAGSLGSQPTTASATSTMRSAPAWARIPNPCTRYGSRVRSCGDPPLNRGSRSISICGRAISTPSRDPA